MLQRAVEMLKVQRQHGGEIGVSERTHFRFLTKRLDLRSRKTFGASGHRIGDFFEAFETVQRNPTKLNLEDRCSLSSVGKRDQLVQAEATGSKQRPVQGFQSVRCANDHDFTQRLNAIHFGQKLADNPLRGLGTFVGAAHGGYRVQLIEEEDRGSNLADSPSHLLNISGPFTAMKLA